jgi:hypothetical protein
MPEPQPGGPGAAFRLVPPPRHVKLVVKKGKAIPVPGHGGP